jgi:bifunctional ADP-heptose synthase (sugar kinase/adenylyltransferase)
MDGLSASVADYVAELRQRHTAEEVFAVLQDVRKLKVLVLGETIVDEYQFCSVLGKASKDPILSTRWCSSERYVGGIMAIARHLAGFCDRLDVLSLLGDHDSHEEFVRQSLPANIAPHFLYQEQSPTIVKRRFVEEYLSRKLFEVYVISDEPISERLDDAICGKLEEMLPQYDLVIVADYGHGMFTRRSIDLLCRRAKFLALNVQTNAGNRGFNFITKYPRADYVSIDEQEIRLEARERRVEVADLIRQTAARMTCPHFLVTRGKHGVTALWEKDGLCQAPALAGRVVDTIGAGDAVLAVTSPFVALKASAALVTLVANCAGAEACLSVGNREAIDPAAFADRLESLLGHFPRINAPQSEESLPEGYRKAS